MAAASDDNGVAPDPVASLLEGFARKDGGDVREASARTTGGDDSAARGSADAVAPAPFVPPVPDAETLTHLLGQGPTYTQGVAGKRRLRRRAPRSLAPVRWRHAVHRVCARLTVRRAALGALAVVCVAVATTGPPRAANAPPHTNADPPRELAASAHAARRGHDQRGRSAQRRRARSSRRGRGRAPIRLRPRRRGRVHVRAGSARARTATARTAAVPGAAPSARPTAAPPSAFTSEFTP
jgi:hypothetical protein